MDVCPDELERHLELNSGRFSHLAAPPQVQPRRGDPGRCTGRRRASFFLRIEPRDLKYVARELANRMRKRRDGVVGVSCAIPSGPEASRCVWVPQFEFGRFQCTLALRNPTIGAPRTGTQRRMPHKDTRGPQDTTGVSCTGCTRRGGARDEDRAVHCAAGPAISHYTSGGSPRCWAKWCGWGVIQVLPETPKKAARLAPIRRCQDDARNDASSDEGHHRSYLREDIHQCVLPGPGGNAGEEAQA